MNGQPSSINGHMDFCGVTRYRFSDGCFLLMGRATTMLMSLHNTAVDKCPFQIRFHHQSPKDAHQFFLKRPRVESFIPGIPLAKRCRQVSPGVAYSQAIKNPLYRLPKSRLVINPQAQHDGFEFIPVFVRKQLSWHRAIIF